MRVRILHTDGTVGHRNINFLWSDHQDMKCGRSNSNALCIIGTDLRKADPTVAKVKSEYGNEWVGHATDEHMEIIAKLERDGVVW